LRLDFASEWQRGGSSGKSQWMLLPAGVTLSRSEGSAALGMEMLRCAQHDSTFRLPLPQGMVIGNFLGSSESLSQEGNRSATEEHLSYEVVRLWRMIS
jgi:hypothetical protein